MPSVISQMEIDDNDIDFSDIDARYALPESYSFDSIVVIDNVPIVDDAKKDKLISVIKKIFKNVGPVKSLEMPKDESTGKSKGYIFMEFETPEQANLAVKVGNNYKMDKSHILAVNKFDDIEKYGEMDDEYVSPTIEEYVEKVKKKNN